MTETSWTTDYQEIVAFGEVLYRAGLLVNPDEEYGDDIFYYLQKPGKWDREHQVWVARGRPGTESDGWELFRRAVDHVYVKDEE